MSQTDGLSGRYPQARSASGHVAILRSTPSVRRSQFGCAPALSITPSLVFSTSGRSISYTWVPGGQIRRKARVSRPAAASTTWRIPNLLQESSRKSSKKRVRITGYNPGPSACAAASRRSSHVKPSGPANMAASGSSNRRSTRSLSRARAAAIHRDVRAIGLMEGSPRSPGHPPIMVISLLARAGREPVSEAGPETAHCPRPSKHAHVPGVHRHVLLVLAAGASSCSLGLSGRNGAVPLARDVEHGAPDVGDVHPVSTEPHLPLDELVALVEVPHPPPEGLAREGCSVVDPLAHRQPRTHGNVSLAPLPHRLQRRVVDA